MRSTYGSIVMAALCIIAFLASITAGAAASQFRSLSREEEKRSLSGVPGICDKDTSCNSCVAAQDCAFRSTWVPTPVPPYFTTSMVCRHDLTAKALWGRHGCELIGNPHRCRRWCLPTSPACTDDSAYCGYRVIAGCTIDNMTNTCVNRQCLTSGTDLCLSCD